MGGEFVVSQKVDWEGGMLMEFIDAGRANDRAYSTYLEMRRIVFGVNGWL